ncbi:uncharacterized protein L3040_000328 [Drepanopeziza brunnea f. sp. 'multigermtubi']|uniref:Uncharacterized protein n=1 Tax=Marssonina brunnea f. sp. multigermtubi (strain MB_m1) TaxID=1072389 RepID=K1XIE5_MARBU|nr:uncharacterized protein MBM_09525 [Drepanopeziza brunnea f. sp. 'multigermtubi' MB_m1]EKD12204.1 hypothetical protein MBM_09525 [Drepanopeziza brunnea f. sp. 'multigermtubi' MB_m1]KAJ5054043.1 hypothetical protein L3040_000328 [Drepanopeziza brunnea f. sp. 'multigermtubi']
MTMTTSPLTPPITPPVPPPSRFCCLQVRLLWEKCGHIETLTIHELPCKKLYRGWLPETSPYLQVKPCPVMTRHLALKRARCERCTEAVVAPKRALFGWGSVGKRDRCGEVVPIAEIVARRTEWIKVMAAQAERNRRRDGARRL